jgi:hypothetical protein
MSNGTRRHFTPQQKAEVVRRHVAGKEPVSKLAARWASTTLKFTGHDIPGAIHSPRSTPQSCPSIGQSRPHPSPCRSAPRSSSILRAGTALRSVA